MNEAVGLYRGVEAAPELTPVVFHEEPGSHIAFMHGVFDKLGRIACRRAAPEGLEPNDRSGEAINKRRDLERAESFYAGAVEGSRRALGGGHPDTVHSVRYLAKLLVNSGRFSEAEPLLLGAYASIEATEAGAGQGEHLLRIGTHITELYESWGDPADADRWRVDVESTSSD